MNPVEQLKVKKPSAPAQHVEEYINSYMKQSSLRTCMKYYLSEYEHCDELKDFIPKPKPKSKKTAEITDSGELLPLPDLPTEDEEPDEDSEIEESESKTTENVEVKIKTKKEIPKTSIKLHKKVILYLSVLCDYIVNKITKSTTDSVKVNKKSQIMAEYFVDKDINGLIWGFEEIPKIDNLETLYKPNEPFNIIKNNVKRHIDMIKGELKNTEHFNMFVALTISNYLRLLSKRMIYNIIYTKCKNIKIEDIIYILTERADSRDEHIPSELTDKYFEVEKQFDHFELFKNDKTKTIEKPLKIEKFKKLVDPTKPIKQRKTKLPMVELPSVELPMVELPSVELPSVELPDSEPVKKPKTSRKSTKKPKAN